MVMPQRQQGLEQLSTLFFGNAANQSVLNTRNGGLAAAVPVMAEAEGKKQAGSSTALSAVAWEQLTIRLFEAAAQETGANDTPTI